MALHLAEASAGVADDKVKRRKRHAVIIVADALPPERSTRPLVAVVVPVQCEVHTEVTEQLLECLAQFLRHRLVAVGLHHVARVDVHRPVSSKDDPRRAFAVDSCQGLLDCRVLLGALVELVLRRVVHKVQRAVLVVEPAPLRG